MLTLDKPPHLANEAKTGSSDPVATEHRVTIDDGFSGVIKVAHLLRHPACEISGFGARRTADPDGWTIDYVCVGTAHQLQMLRKRVYRLPGVRKIECRHALKLP
ncbi:hypothetical protein AXA44_25015 [Rhodococcus sp. SC4]|nr:hypothetical protein AXA44_25015 [Rhodococcus sp. SC4]